MKLRFKVRSWKDNLHLGDGRVIRPDRDDPEVDGGPKDVLFEVDDAIAEKLIGHPRIQKTPGAPKKVKDA